MVKVALANSAARVHCRAGWVYGSQRYEWKVQRCASRLVSSCMDNWGYTIAESYLLQAARLELQARRSGTLRRELHRRRQGRARDLRTRSVRATGERCIGVSCIITGSRKARSGCPSGCRLRRASLQPGPEMLLFVHESVLRRLLVPRTPNASLLCLRI